jgi:Domain of unknown function (DUF4111)/Nucleotidyltransferase domain
MKEGPTPYSDVNAVLSELSVPVQVILGSHFVGMYLYGSLALGNFDSRTSDIDCIVVTDSQLSEGLVTDLDRMHAHFNASGSPWSSRIEAAYIPRNALRADAPTTARYPQIETGRRLMMEPLESGWALQVYTLREHGIVIAGPDPQTLMSPVDRNDIRKASAAHAVVWATQAHGDPDWLDWVRHREHQAFVVLTLCRMLYSLSSGRVASKPQAARWMVQTTGTRWAALIQAALAGQFESGVASDGDIRYTIELIDFTAERYRCEIAR